MRLNQDLLPLMTYPCEFSSRMSTKKQVLRRDLAHPPAMVAIHVLVNSFFFFFSFADSFCPGLLFMAFASSVLIGLFVITCRSCHRPVVIT